VNPATPPGPAFGSPPFILPQMFQGLNPIGAAASRTYVAAPGQAGTWARRGLVRPGCGVKLTFQAGGGSITAWYSTRDSLTIPLRVYSQCDSHRKRRVLRGCFGAHVSLPGRC
jgi:hypothetical protein